MRIFYCIPLKSWHATVTNRHCSMWPKTAKTNKQRRPSGWQRLNQHGHQGMERHAALPMSLSGEGEERTDGLEKRERTPNRTSRQGKPSDSWPGMGESRQGLAVRDGEGVWLFQPWQVHIAAVPGFSIDNASVIPHYQRAHV